LSVDNAITVAIEHIESLLHVEVVDEECCCHLVKHLVQSLLAKLNSFEPLTKSMQIDLANALWIGNSTHDALVLDTQRKVQLIYILLKLPD